MKPKILVVLAVTMLIFLMTACQRQPAEISEELKRDLDRLELQINELDKKLGEVDAALSTLRRNFEANSSDLAAQIEKIKDSQSIIKTINADINNRITGELLIIGKGKPWPAGVKVLLIVIIIVLVLILYKVLAGRKGEEIEEEEEFAAVEPEAKKEEEEKP